MTSFHSFSAWCDRPRRLFEVNYFLHCCHGSSEQVGQDEARRFGLHTVNPEIGAAGVVLVAPVRQLEVVRLRVKSLSRGERLDLRTQSEGVRRGKEEEEESYIDAPYNAEGFKFTTSWRKTSNIRAVFSESLKEVQFTYWASLYKSFWLIWHQIWRKTCLDVGQFTSLPTEVSVF